MPSTQTHSGFSSPGFWLKVCRQGKLQSAQRPGQDTQPHLLGTVVLEGVRMRNSHSHDSRTTTNAINNISCGYNEYVKVL